MRRPELYLFVAPLLGLSLSFACRSTLECEPGSLSCECAADNACNEGLICVDEVCISDDGSETSSDTAEDTTGGGSESSTTSGDGDESDASSSTDAGDGDGDSSSESGDGDSATTGDGDGDGDTTGGDGDGDACDPGFTCQDAIPNGWEGPVVVSESAAVLCPSDWPQQVHSALGTTPDFGSLECGCECDDPQGVVCGPTLGFQGTSNCTTNPFFNPDEYIGFGECLPTAGSGLAGDTFIKTWGLTTNLDDASCSPSPSETLTEPSFGGLLKSCGTSFDACGTDGYCEPPTAGAFERVCVYNSGAVACPAERFTDQIFGFDGFDDQRECSECTCSAPQGSCDVPVYYTNLACATTGQAILVASGGPSECMSNIDADYISVGNPDTSGVGCAPSEPTVTGTVTPTGSVTVCCEPI
jgi:hypothetical protein